MSSQWNNGASASRRAVLQALAAAATLSVLPSGVQAMATPARLDFLRASAKLSGIELDRSYLQLADDIWTLLTLSGEQPYRRLVALVQRVPEQDLPQALRRAGLETEARRLLNVWYRGQIELRPADLDNPAVQRICGDLRERIDPDHQRRPVTAVIDYDEALSWQACSFTKPSATCGGPFGYWSEPPAPSETVAVTGKNV
ncbi:hypothetical protein [Marinobacterium arenosum]|uniref:hypothetical protein n=1 Tax=Marinobacterium arenosum TaxID=2862496 RepID=UPI001C94BED5|nr:hypothetical protein [Marinobacterium arenosum]MBY4677037.1 hypothetical protein [Marinobacterium arenosum]